MMKKKKTMLILLIIMGIVVFAIILGVCIWNQGQKEKLPDVPMPGIAFEYYTTKKDCFYICSDGRIFKSTSTDSYYMPNKELISRIEQGNYEDILKYKGKTNARKVQEMYNLFTEVVLNSEYKSYYIRVDGPNGEDSHSSEWGCWYGYYEKDGEIIMKCFYTTEKRYSDERALIIVDWMNKVLAKYK